MVRASGSLFLLLQFATFAQGYKTFESICSTPTTPVNYVSSADTRGTLDILWSCLFTIIACTWTVQHLNVPEQREGRDPGWRGDIKWALKRTWMNTKWMLVTIIAPEIILSKNMGDLGDAKFDLAALKRFAEIDGVPWTMTHSLFANIGGFVIRGHSKGRIGKAPEPMGGAIDQAHAPTFQLSNMHETGQDEIRKVASEVEPMLYHRSSTSPNPNPFHLRASDILVLREYGWLQRLPYLSTEEINDKSKSDTFVRVIAVVQISWMIVQIIGRAARDLAISQLEIAVVAFAVCGVTLYGLNWAKPKAVQVPLTIFNYPGDIPETLCSALVNKNKSSKTRNQGLVWKLFGDLLVSVWGTRRRIILGAPIPNDFTHEDEASTPYGGMGMAFGCIAFGCVHLFAWNAVFPTKIEQIAWWAASIYCTVFIVLLVVLVLLTSDPVSKYFTVSLSSLYVLARLFLLVEIFRTLCFLPPDAFTATWAANIPHLS